MSDKPRMVEVPTNDLQVMQMEGAQPLQAQLALPYMHLHNGKYYADADELRAWREARLQHTSRSEHE
jgi:hypothetical protein